ncbi:MAG: hypothetical protein U5K77_01755 [Candidatus Saccharibacteria bacterium]|nr:hypothetical protein [Candidatus Saccharibacteria bacterium]
MNNLPKENIPEEQGELFNAAPNTEGTGTDYHIPETRNGIATNEATLLANDINDSDTTNRKAETMEGKERKDYESNLGSIPESNEQKVKNKKPTSWNRMLGAGAALALVAGGAFAGKSLLSDERSETNGDNATADLSQDVSPEDLRFNGYTPSVAEFPGSEYLTEENMEIYNNPEIDDLVDRYNLRKVSFEYSEYGNTDLADYAWRHQHPNQYVDLSSLSQNGVNEAEVQELAPIYLHNHIVAQNIDNDSKVWNVPDFGYITPRTHLFLASATTFENPPTVTTNSDKSIELSFSGLDIQATNIEKIRPLETIGNTGPRSWTMDLTIGIDPETGKPVYLRHDAEEVKS